MSTKFVINVGQCNPDHTAISGMLKNNFDCEISTAHSLDAIKSICQSRAEAGQPVDLILVNRLLDQCGSSGIELITELNSDPATEPVTKMLVSNFEEAQQQAEQAGAVRGFGKNAVTDDSTVQTIREVLG